MRYRRADTKGGTYFSTVNLAERQLRLLVDHVAVLRSAVKFALGFASSPQPTICKEACPRPAAP